MMLLLMLLWLHCMQNLDEQDKIERPPVQYYNLSHNLTGDITYHRVDDITWTTTEANASQTYIIRVTLVNIFGQGIPTGTLCVCMLSIFICVIIFDTSLL